MSINRTDDEQLLIDFLLGRCARRADVEVRRRLDTDASFRQLRDDLMHTLAAMDLCGRFEPPQTLVAETVNRIQRHQQARDLLHGGDSRRRAYRATFSLGELGALAAAIVLLVMVFVPAIRRARQRALLGRCMANAGQIGVGLRTYANANAGWLPVAAGLSRRWLQGGDQPAASNSAGLFRLVKRRYVSPDTFHCPGSESADQDGFGVRADMNDFPSAATISYSYQHTIGTQSLPQARSVSAGVTSRMAILADETPVFRDGRFLRRRVRDLAGDNHDAVGQNVLYLDMHVEFQRGANVGVDGNNIFLADGIFDYRGDETPVNPTDSFLLPAFSGS